MQEELTYIERKEWAKLLYTRHETNCKDTALIVGADEADVRKWAKDDAWDGVKRSLLIAKATQLENYYMVLEQLNRKLRNAEEISPKDVDLTVKYTTAIKNLETETPIQGIIETFELFVLWLRRKDLSLAKKFIVRLDAYVKEQLAA